MSYPPIPFLYISFTATNALFFSNKTHPVVLQASLSTFPIRQLKSLRTKQTMHKDTPKCDPSN